MISLPKTASEEPYLKLAEKFSSYRMIGPPAREEKLLRLLFHCFTPEEAAVALVLPYFYKPASLDKIAKAAGKPAEEVRPLLESMTGKGLIRGKRKGYALLPLLPGMFENVLLMGDDTPWHRQFVRYANDLFETGYIRRHIQQPVPIARTIPVEKTIYFENVTIDNDHMSEIIEAHTLMGTLHNCQCRQARYLAGQECRKADRSDGCLVFGRVAKIFIERGSARQVTKREMREIVKDRRKKGLTFLSGNVGPSSPNLICTCCDCCCSMINQIVRPSPKSIISPPRYYVQVNRELCVDCGKCVSACNISAHALLDGIHSFDRNRCVGCGVCVTVCPADAISFVENKRYRKPASGFIQLGMKIIPGRLFAMAKEKLARKN